MGNGRRLQGSSAVEVEAGTFSLCDARAEDNEGLRRTGVVKGMLAINPALSGKQLCFPDSCVKVAPRRRRCTAWTSPRGALSTLLTSGRGAQSPARSSAGAPLQPLHRWFCSMGRSREFLTRQKLHQSKSVTLRVSRAQNASSESVTRTGQAQDQRAWEEAPPHAGSCSRSLQTCKGGGNSANMSGGVREQSLKTKRWLSMKVNDSRYYATP